MILAAPPWLLIGIGLAGLRRTTFITDESLGSFWRWNLVSPENVNVGVPVAVAALDTVMLDEVAFAVTYVLAGIPVPVTLEPNQTGPAPTAPKSAAEVIVVLVFVVVETMP